MDTYARRPVGILLKDFSFCAGEELCEELFDVPGIFVEGDFPGFDYWVFEVCDHFSKVFWDDMIYSMYLGRLDWSYEGVFLDLPSLGCGDLVYRSHAQTLLLRMSSVEKVYRIMEEHKYSLLEVTRICRIEL